MLPPARVRRGTRARPCPPAADRPPGDAVNATDADLHRVRIDMYGAVNWLQPVEPTTALLVNVALAALPTGSNVHAGA